ncbi:C6 finger domain protein [Pyrenophora teres f. maculata]|nr:C6 finger domain protein [Pyrenophora teres f. maculata]
MVYTGKPSRGCGMCKSRRIKWCWQCPHCDEKRPTCGNCKKSSRPCPGYPDDFDLVFRDENKAMLKKVRKCSGTTSPGSSTGASSSHPSPHPSPSSTFEVVSEENGCVGEPAFHTATSSSHASQSQQVLPVNNYKPQQVPFDHPFDFETFVWNLQTARVPHTMSLAPECEAVPFFFKNFTALPQQAESTRGFLEYLVPLYNRARPNSVLHLATTAVALAACGQYPGRHELLREAVSTYGKAIKKLNEDLKHPAKAKSNETVLAILMFSLYETIMSTDDTIAAWGNHVDGAVALTKLRGMEQFKDPMSHAIFRAVRTMMITSCVQRSKPVDSFPSKAGWIGQGDIHNENAANRLTLICIDLPSLRARANTLTNMPYDPAYESEAKQILDFAQLVDGNLEEWYRTLPPEWRPRIIGVVSELIPSEELSLAAKWPGEQHVYHDVPLASIMNDYRVCRIFCTRVIMACVEWLNSGPNYRDGDIAWNKSVYVIQKMVDEICACVPFHLSYELQTAAKEMGQEKNAAEAFGGYSLVWPLYVAANADTVPQEQRDWLFGRLSVIGTKFGLSSAQVLVLARRHVLTCGPMFP